MLKLVVLAALGFVMVTEVTSWKYTFYKKPSYGCALPERSLTSVNVIA